MMLTPAYDRTQLIVFDWDGTLFDSTGVIAHCLQQACMALNFKVPSMVQAQQVIGLGIHEAVESLVGPLSTTQFNDFKAAYQRNYLSCENLVMLFAGIDDLMVQLKQQGKYLAIATGKSRAGLNRVLQHNPMFKQYFITSRTADETQSKPHPQMLHEILEELDLQATQAVMVGDTTFDIEMAHQAQMPSIAVAYGAHDELTLQSAKPTHLVHNVTQLAQLFGINR